MTTRPWTTEDTARVTDILTDPLRRGRFDLSEDVERLLAEVASLRATLQGHTAPFDTEKEVCRLMGDLFDEGPPTAIDCRAVLRALVERLALAVAGKEKAESEATFLRGQVERLEGEMESLADAKAAEIEPVLLRFSARFGVGEARPPSATRERLSAVREQIAAYDGGDRAMSPPVALLREERELAAKVAEEARSPAAATQDERARAACSAYFRELTGCDSSHRLAFYAGYRARTVDASHPAPQSASVVVLDKYLPNLIEFPFPIGVGDKIGSEELRVLAIVPLPATLYGQPVYVALHEKGSVGGFRGGMLTMFFAREGDAVRPEPQSGSLAQAGCTGLTATWCPRCGDCACPWVNDDEAQGRALDCADCLLHSPQSKHAEGERSPQSDSLAGTPVAAQPLTEDEAQRWAALRPLVERVARGEWTGTVLGAISDAWNASRGDIPPDVRPPHMHPLSPEDAARGLSPAWTDDKPHTWTSPAGEMAKDVVTATTAPGTCVRTAERLSGSAAYLPLHGRVAGVTGVIVRRRESPVLRFDVRHDKDGNEAPYDADELTVIGGSS